MDRKCIFASYYYKIGDGQQGTDHIECKRARQGEA